MWDKAINNQSLNTWLSNQVRYQTPGVHRNHWFEIKLATGVKSNLWLNVICVSVRYESSHHDNSGLHDQGLPFRQRPCVKTVFLVTSLQDLYKKWLILFFHIFAPLHFPPSPVFLELHNCWSASKHPRQKVVLNYKLLLSNLRLRCILLILIYPNLSMIYFFLEIAIHFFTLHYIAIIELEWVATL